MYVGCCDLMRIMASREGRFRRCMVNRRTSSLSFYLAGLLAAGSFVFTLAARAESPTAFGRRCIPADCVAPPSNIPDILGRRALPAGRLAALGATPDFQHGLRAEQSPAGASLPPDAHSDVVKRFCVSCHNDRLKRGGLALDTVAAHDVADHPDVWEKVLRK